MFFEAGSYKVHIYSWSVPHHNHGSAQPQFGEAERRSALEEKPANAVLLNGSVTVFVIHVTALYKCKSGCSISSQSRAFNSPFWPNKSVSRNHDLYV